MTRKVFISAIGLISAGLDFRKAGYVPSKHDYENRRYRRPWNIITIRFMHIKGLSLVDYAPSQCNPFLFAAPVISFNGSF
jgi:hypothetical protein